MADNVIEFKKVATGTRGDSTYQAEGFGTIYLAKSVETHPASILVAGLEPNSVKVKEAKPKMTKEERKAAREAMTPEQKLAEAQERVRKASERAAKLAAKLAAPAPEPVAQ